MQLDTEATRAETGRRLGYDLYLYRSRVEDARLPPSVIEGFALAAARKPARAVPDRFARKWLQLRTQALMRGCPFDEQVTPLLLQKLDVAECPVTRVVLTHGELKDSDWSIDRLNNDGGYAANNLVVMSTRANQAKGRLTFEEVIRLAQPEAPSRGLQPVEWQRMAALMLGPCFARAPAQAPLLPHAVPVTSHRLLLASQQIQHVFCTQAGSQTGKNALIKAFRAASPLERADFRLRELAERIHADLKGSTHACDVWLRPEAMTALLRWREVLDDASWGRAGEISRRLAGARRVSPLRLESWQLDHRTRPCAERRAC